MNKQELRKTIRDQKRAMTEEQIVALYGNGNDGSQGITGTGAVDKETGKAHVRDVDKWESIADADFLSESEIDTAMKLYMPDYDPEDESPNKTELKYDYARQEWGLSAAEYAAIYRVQADGDNKEEKVAGWKALGYSDKECELLWNLFGSSGKNKIDVVSWYEQQQ
jgi:hypothetical protein